MSSIEPDDSGGQMEGTQKVARRLVVACGNGAVLLELGKEVFDQVPGLVQVAVIAALVLARTQRWNHYGFAGLQQWLDQSVMRVISLVGKLPIDNNWIENQMRPVALGRKNWLFAGSVRAGQRAAAVMSLIQSTKLNGHGPA